MTDIKTSKKSADDSLPAVLRRRYKSLREEGYNEDFCRALTRAAEALERCGHETSRPLSSRAAEDVLAERERQTSAEGWTVEHDDEHTDGSLAMAAACYALPPDQRRLEYRPFERDVGRTVGEPIIIKDRVRVPFEWPGSWHGAHWKPKDRRRDLVRAAALLLAEIERLDRAPRGCQEKSARPCHRCDSADAETCSGGDYMTICRCKCHL